MKFAALSIRCWSVWPPGNRGSLTLAPVGRNHRKSVVSETCLHRRVSLRVVVQHVRAPQHSYIVSSPTVNEAGDYTSRSAEFESLDRLLQALSFGGGIRPRRKHSFDKQRRSRDIYRFAPSSDNWDRKEEPPLTRLLAHLLPEGKPVIVPLRHSRKSSVDAG